MGTKYYCSFGSDSKESACNVGDPGSTPGLGRSPGEGNGNPLHEPCNSSHGQRSLVGYSPWGCKKSRMTERLHFHFLSMTDGIEHIFICYFYIFGEVSIQIFLLDYFLIIKL